MSFILTYGKNFLFPRTFFVPFSTFFVPNHISCSREHFLFPGKFFELDSTPKTTTKTTTKLLLGPLSVARGQKLWKQTIIINGLFVMDNRLQPLPYLYSIGIWLAWVAGRRNAQLPIDLFIEHQQFVVCSPFLKESKLRIFHETVFSSAKLAIYLKCNLVHSKEKKSQGCFSILLVARCTVSNLTCDVS